MNNKISFLVFVSLFSLLMACNKEALVSNEKPLTETSKAVKKPNVFDPGALSLEGYTGDNIEENLESVEELLNATYCYPDQSIGAINTVETEFTITPENGSYLTETEAEILYANALSVLSEAYYDFEWDNPQSILVDIERVETSDPSEVKVTVSAQVGEPNEEAVAPPPCENSTFVQGNYELYKPKPPLKTKRYASDFMTRKLNSKINNNPCVYYAMEKPLTGLTSEQKRIQVSDLNGGVLTAQQMKDYYCLILERIQSYPIPEGYQIASVVITSDIALCQCGGVFYINVTIAKPRIKSPCDPNGPKNVPPPNG
jgi:hypothetical protein